MPRLFDSPKKRFEWFQARYPGNTGISVPFCMEIRIEVWNHLSLLYILYVFPKRKMNSNIALLPLYLLCIHHNLIGLNFEASPRLLSESSWLYWSSTFSRTLSRVWRAFRFAAFACNELSMGNLAWFHPIYGNREAKSVTKVGHCIIYAVWYWLNSSF